MLKVVVKVVERLARQSSLIAFGLVIIGALLLFKNDSPRSLSGLLGAALIAIGTLFIGVAFIVELIREEGERAGGLYKHAMGVQRDLTKHMQGIITGGGEGGSSGKKRSYTPLGTREGTEAE